MTTDTHAPRDEAELEERLSRPSPSLASTLAPIAGDLVILGAGGKMGPTLARMAKRANPERRVIEITRAIALSDRIAQHKFQTALVTESLRRLPGRHSSAARLG